MKKTFAPTFIFVAFAVLVMLSGLACRVFVPGSSANAPAVVTQVVQKPVQPQTPAQPQTVINLAEDESLIGLYERVNPSVMNITIYNTANDGSMITSSSGSGFVFDTQGHIVTNAHVVANAEQIEVTFSDGLIRQAELVGDDLNSDLAVIRVADMPAGIGPLPLGSMDSLRVGQTVVAIGNPFRLQGTLTRGIISAMGRTIPALNTFSIPESIQTDAAINPGNSGGPLLNLAGEVIGVNAQIETSSGSAVNSGVGFAIPVSIIERVVPELIANGEYVWPWVGVRGSALSYELIKGMELPVEKGAYIWQVMDGGPADKANMRGYDRTIEVDGRPADVGGDVITAINGQPIESFDDLLIYVALQTRPGDTLNLTVIRDGNQIELSVKLEARPTD